MWFVESLGLVNFGSYKDTSVSFLRGKVVAITGVSGSKQNSNGSGKSFLLEGLFFALTGDSLRKVVSKDLIYRGESKGRVSIVLKNETTELQITRHIKLKGSGTLEVLQGGEAKNFISISDGNKWIEEQLGVSKEELANYYIVSKRKYKSFFLSSDTDKKRLIIRFSQAELVDKAVEALEEDRMALQREKSILLQAVTELRCKVVYLQEDLTNLGSVTERKAKIEKDIAVWKEEVKSLPVKCKSLGVEKKAITKRLSVLNEEMDVLQGQLVPSDVIRKKREMVATKETTFY